MQNHDPDYRLGTCAKCRVRGSQLRDPDTWCRDCMKKHQSEYRTIIAERIKSHAAEYMRRGGVPERFQNCSFEGFVTNSRELEGYLTLVERWSRNLDVSGLYLCGDVGVGKTHLAVSALRLFLCEKPTGQFVFVAANDLVRDLRESFFEKHHESIQEIYRKLISTDVLLLDDIGAGKATEFAAQSLFDLVDLAYRQKTPRLIVTSNLDVSSIASKLDCRLADRLLEMCLCVRMTGQSYRQKIAEARVRRFNELTHPGAG
jgi:DNA replication protein DnaC